MDLKEERFDYGDENRLRVIATLIRPDALFSVARFNSVNVVNCDADVWWASEEECEMCEGKGWIETGYIDDFVRCTNCINGRRAPVI
jgi:hypothetical protein